jgi:ADP-heptose:LPS heptosyltransferase
MKKKIVIFRNGSYGDSLVSIPCLKIIKINNKQSDIHYLTIQNVNTKFFKPQKLFSKFGLNFKFKIINKKKLYIINLIRYLIKNKFDEMYYLKEDPTCFIFKNTNKFFTKINIFFEYIFFKILFIKKILGLEFKNFVTDTYHEKESLRLIKRFYLKPANEDEIINSISQNNIIKNKTIIICFGGKFKVKDWGLSNWEALIKLIIKYKKKQKFLIIGNSKDETDKAKYLVKIFPNNCKSFINQPFEKLISTVSKSMIYIGHDTANMHLSALLGLKTISIFSSRETRGKWFPIGLNHINYYKNIPCSNCKLTDFCDYNKKCINSFKPLNLFNDIKKFI